MSILISAVICTHNRVEYLPKAIRSLAQQTLDRQLYEIIVVDNASTDNTREVLVNRCSTMTNLRYVYEARLGLSRARNMGWEKARGKYVAYLDDDAIACSDWLENIVSVFRNVQPTPGCVAGRVDPLWDAPRPAWLSDALLCAFTIVDWSGHPKTLNRNEWPAGTNMAFPKSLLRAVGGFDVALGRKGMGLLSMEEVLLRLKLEKMGYTSYYDPAIRVVHLVSSSRLTKGWLARRWFWQGVSGAITRVRLKSLTALRRLSFATSAVKKLFLSPEDLLNLVTPTNDPNRFARKCLTLRDIGHISGLLGIVR